VSSVCNIADDTILFLQNDFGMARNLKWLLTCFEQLSGMRVNYHKRDLLTISVDPDEANLFAQIFGCKLGEFSFTYLGIPLDFAKLRKEDLQPIIDKIIKRISGWRGKLLSYKARLILLQACVASIPMYLLSFLKFPKWAIKLINSQMAQEPNIVDALGREESLHRFQITFRHVKVTARWHFYVNTVKTRGIIIYRFGGAREAAGSWGSVASPHYTGIA
jgi:hypothetical protein